MKKQIICTTCVSNNPGLFDNGYPYPGEKVINKRGLAKRDYVCDNCGEPLVEGVECCAVSFTSTHGAHKYYEWDGEFFDEIEEFLKKELYG